MKIRGEQIRKLLLWNVTKQNPTTYVRMGILWPGVFQYRPILGLVHLRSFGHVPFCAIAGNVADKGGTGQHGAHGSTSDAVVYQNVRDEPIVYH